jgi:hypothetical protein
MKRNKVCSADTQHRSSIAAIILFAVFFWATFFATPSFAAIGFRAAASANLVRGEITVTVGTFAERANCGNITPSIPAGHVGDLLIAQVVARRNAATVTMAGWNTLYADNVAGANYQVFLFYRSATGGDPNTINQAGTCNLLMARITRFANVDTAQPLEFAAGEPPLVGNSVYSDDNDVDTGTQIVNVVNSMLVLAHFAADDRNLTQPGTFAEIYDDADNSGSDGAISLNYRYETTTGTKGPFTNMTLTPGGNSSDPNHGVLFAVRPSPGLTINVPTGTVANDVMIAGITMRPCSNSSGGACTVTITPPAGWTLVDSVDQTTGAGTDGYGNRLFVYRRVATGAEPASHTWTFGGTPVQAGAAGGILSFSGVDTSNPVVVSGGQTTGYSYTHAAPSIDTGTVTDTMLVSTHSINSSGTWTPPGTMTERVDIASLSPQIPDELGLSLEMNHELRAAAGATGTRTATLSNPPANDTGATHMLALRPAALIDHYELSLAASSITCLATTVTVTACADGNNPCTKSTAVNGTTADLSTSAGALGATAVTFDATGDATTTLSYPTAADGTAATVTLSGEDQAAANPRQCCQGGSCVVADSCTTTFNTAGFIFSDTVGGAAATISAQAAGISSGTYYLRAVRTSTTTQACEAALVGANTVDMAYECNNPTTCSGTDLMSVDGGAATTIARNDNGSVSSYTPVDMTFDADGNAPFTFLFSDVGLATLQARKLAGGSLLSDLTGISDDFVTRPDHFDLSAIKCTTADAANCAPGALPSGNNPGAGSAAGPSFIQAGKSFSVTVTARDANGNATPNYGRENSPEGVKLTPNLVFPTVAAGGNNPPLVNATAFGSFTNGVATGTTFAWSEVGIITLTPEIGDGNYLGAGNVTGAASGNVGRFIPHYFDVTRSEGCGSFTYSGQPLSLVTVTARAVGGTKTDNYHDFGGGIVFSKDTTISDDTGSTANFTNFNITASEFTNGIHNKLDLIYTFPVKETPPATLALRAIDTDTVSSAGFLEEAAGIRSGRINLFNAYGSELMTVSLPMKAEFYQDTAGPPATMGWIKNGADTCTALAVAELDLQNDIDDPAQGVNSILIQPGLPSNVTVVSPAAGVGSLDFSAPGAGGDGFADARMDLSTLPWLRFDWDNAGPEDDPIGRATFGLYRGSPAHIYMRQRY